MLSMHSRDRDALFMVSEDKYFESLSIESIQRIKYKTNKNKNKLTVFLNTTNYG
jgi:hypothetical protein